MERVITINLNGNAYQLDEPGYTALLAYLDDAAATLANNPDRNEILSDFEQAIAEKCSTFLGRNKTVVTASEVQRIIDEMGPVDDDADDADDDDQAGERDGKDRRRASEAPRRLYQIREGAMISGVCRGLAAYFDIDVTIVRVVFVILALVTSGFWALVYVALTFIIPYARTSEERAAAHGRPFNAQEVIDEAKRVVSEVKSKDWAKEGRAWRDGWKQTVREARWRGPAVRQQAAYATRVWAGVLMPLFSFLHLVLFVLLAFLVFTLIDSGQVFGWALPDGFPLWVGVIGLLVLYSMVSAPLHHGQRAAAVAYGDPPVPGAALVSAMLSIGLAVFFFWLVIDNLPEIGEFLQNDLAPAIRRMVQSIRDD